jgi:hypothetical protein
MATGRYHWSHGAHGPRFYGINAAACIPLLVLVLHPSWMGLYVVLATIGFLLYVEKVKKMTLRSFFRSFNILLTGRVKSSLNLFKEISR